jgi:hypothetical protein
MTKKSQRLSVERFQVDRNRDGINTAITSVQPAPAT